MAHIYATHHNLYRELYTVQNNKIVSFAVSLASADTCFHTNTEHLVGSFERFKQN